MTQQNYSGFHPIKEREAEENIRDTLHVYVYGLGKSAGQHGAGNESWDLLQKLYTNLSSLKCRHEKMIYTVLYTENTVHLGPENKRPLVLWTKRKLRVEE